MQNDTLRKQTVGKARKILLDDEGLSETWTDLVVNALEYALWGTAKTEVDFVYDFDDGFDDFDEDAF